MSKSRLSSFTNCCVFTSVCIINSGLGDGLCLTLLDEPEDLADCFVSLVAPSPLYNVLILFIKSLSRANPISLRIKCNESLFRIFMILMITLL